MNSLTPLVQMENIQKRFPGVHALNDCQLTLFPGEVLALVGENGAGKSTLMKVLTGIYQKDDGVIRIKGKEVEFHSPRDAQAAGVGIIHQELNLMPHLTVAENIFIGREPTKGLFLDMQEANRKARELLQGLKIDIDPETKISQLTVAKQQMVEIAKAMSFESDVIIMDEPTAALTETEIDELFRFIREMREKKHSIIYISHRMEELAIIADRVTVMRDGQYVGTGAMKDLSRDDIINMMVGRTIFEDPKQKSNVPKDAPVVLEVKGLSSGLVKNVNFKLRRGEILGFAGLMGAGRTETARLIFGADPRDEGEIYIHGQKVDIKSPNDAVTHGIGYLSEDRKRYGLALGLSVTDNAILATLRDFVKSIFVDEKKADATVKGYVDRINIRTPHNRQLCKNLSGGNQQKVVLAKWLIRNCEILIFDEPTRGIDVGAKNEIYKLMNMLVENGKSIIMISSELPELFRMSDRIIVMCEGAQTAEVPIEAANQQSIMQFATQYASAKGAV